MFKKATKEKQKLRLLIEGASGSGKTYSALIIAQTIAKKLNKKIAFIDTEYGSASLYADKFDFDTLELEAPFTPEKYINAIKEASECGDYGVLIIDSISHEWSGPGGCLDIQSALGGTFNDWKRVTPRHQKFINSILESKIHIIGCARTKSDYVMEEGFNSKGKATTKPVKVGTKTEQREGLEFEFTTIFRLNQNHVASVSKDRTSIFENKDAIITEQTAIDLLNWLDSGSEPSEKEIKQEEKKDEIDEFQIYNDLYSLDNVKDIEKFYLKNKNKVSDKNALIEACKQRKESLINVISFNQSNIT